MLFQFRARFNKADRHQFGLCFLPADAPNSSVLRIMHVVDLIHLDFPFMGSNQLGRALFGQGYQVGSLHMRTLMVKTGI